MKLLQLPGLRVIHALRAHKPLRASRYQHHRVLGNAVLSVVAAMLAVAPALVVAQALSRPIPADAKRGTLSHLAETTLSLDGRSVKLAPGGTIRDTANLVIMPTAVPRDSLVKYRTNAAGEITSAWILTAEEAARPDPAGGSSAPSVGTGSGYGYTEPPGTPIERVLGTESRPTGYGPPPAKRQ